MAYQKFYDPPGDRLVKMHIAGVDGPDLRSFTQVLISSYSALSAGQIVSNKWENFKMAFGYVIGYYETIARLLLSYRDVNGSVIRKEIIINLNAQWFFVFMPSLGFLATGLPALLIGIHKRRRSREWQSALLFLAFVLITNAIWCLLMFGPRTAIIHQGTYVTLPLAYAGCVLALWAVSKWLVIAMAALQISAQAFYYLWLFHPIAPLQYGMFTLSLVGLITTLFLLRKLPLSQASRQLTAL